jgi:hypothetical protein
MAYPESPKSQGEKDDNAIDCIPPSERGTAGLPTVDKSLKAGELSLEDAAAGGIGRHLGKISTTLLMFVFSLFPISQLYLFKTSPRTDNPHRVGRIIGTGIFSTPSSITSGVGSVGAALMLWALGFFLSLAGLFVWLEFGCMFPRSGGEKVYLEAAYRRPRSLATVVFACYTVTLGFTGEFDLSPEFGKAWRRENTVKIVLMYE